MASLSIPDWLAALAFGLLWLEVVARLRFEWSVDPQYGYGWTVPFLAGYCDGFVATGYGNEADAEAAVREQLSNVIRPG